jgi:CubicO group peptidase (beta-lactamase class C family)
VTACAIRQLGTPAWLSNSARLGKDSQGMDIAGWVQRRFEPVRDAFVEVLRAQRGTGAAVAAWWDGAWVVDLWGGRADQSGTRRWQRDSVVQPYSVSKPFAAVAVLVLVDRGHLDLDAPVQRYWPELRARADVRQLLSHQAGLVLLDEPAPTEVFYDWDWMCRLLAAQDPVWEPGAAHGESALFYGICSANSCGASTVGGPDASCARMSADRWVWTSTSALRRRSRPERWI